MRHRHLIYSIGISTLHWRHKCTIHSNSFIANQNSHMQWLEKKYITSCHIESKRKVPSCRNKYSPKICLSPFVFFCFFVCISPRHSFNSVVGLIWVVNISNNALLPASLRRAGQSMLSISWSRRIVRGQSFNRSDETFFLWKDGIVFGLSLGQTGHQWETDWTVYLDKTPWESQLHLGHSFLLSPSLYLFSYGTFIVRWPWQLRKMVGWWKLVAMQLAPVWLAWRQVKVDSDLVK